MAGEAIREAVIRTKIEFVTDEQSLKAAKAQQKQLQGGERAMRPMTAEAQLFRNEMRGVARATGSVEQALRRAGTAESRVKRTVEDELRVRQRMNREADQLTQEMRQQAGLSSRIGQRAGRGVAAAGRGIAGAPAAVGRGLEGVNSVLGKVALPVAIMSMAPQILAGFKNTLETTFDAINAGPDSVFEPGTPTNLIAELANTIAPSPSDPWPVSVVKTVVDNFIPDFAQPEFNADLFEQKIVDTEKERLAVARELVSVEKEHAADQLEKIREQKQLVEEQVKSLTDLRDTSQQKFGLLDFEKQQEATRLAEKIGDQGNLEGLSKSELEFVQSSGVFDGLINDAIKKQSALGGFDEFQSALGVDRDIAEAERKQKHLAAREDRVSAPIEDAERRARALEQDLLPRIKEQAIAEFDRLGRERDRQVGKLELNTGRDRGTAAPLGVNELEGASLEELFDRHRQARGDAVERNRLGEELESRGVTEIPPETAERRIQRMEVDNLQLPDLPTPGQPPQPVGPAAGGALPDLPVPGPQASRELIRQENSFQISVNVDLPREVVDAIAGEVEPAMERLQREALQTARREMDRRVERLRFGGVA